MYIVKVRGNGSHADVIIKGDASPFCTIRGPGAKGNFDSAGEAAKCIARFLNAREKAEEPRLPPGAVCGGLKKLYGPEDRQTDRRRDER